VTLWLLWVLGILVVGLLVLVSFCVERIAKFYRP